MPKVKTSISLSEKFVRLIEQLADASDFEPRNEPGDVFFILDHT